MLTVSIFLQNMLHFMKILTAHAAKKIHYNKTVLIPAAWVAAVLMLTISGVPGTILTAYADSSITSLESPKQRDKDSQEVLLADTRQVASGKQELKNVQAEIQTELASSKRYGQMVVGYRLTQEMQQKEEIRENGLSKIEEIKQQILIESKKEEEKALFKTAGISYSADDYQVLLRIVQAEAGICDAKGKILVANVIINRVHSKEFPDTIRSVVYQPFQFSPVSNGTIDSCIVTSETIECVGRALAGEDYSQGALYFMNRNGSKNSSARWFDAKLNYLFQYGGHEFFK